MIKSFLKRILLIFVCPLLLVGCWDAKEVGLMYYAHAVGIDYKDGQYFFYVQIMDFDALGKREQQSKSSEFGAWVGSSVTGA